MTITAQQQRALNLIVSAILDTVREVAPLGAPASALYLACTKHGASLNQFESLMGALVRLGALKLEADCYFIGDKKGTATP